jgi:N-acetylglutamate synthase-like GNAT family acetyltransferase
VAAHTAISAQEHRRGKFLISTDRKRLDLNVIHAFLTECYWAKGILREIVARSIENSLCFGVYEERQQIGFARVISDFATYAYIGDVFVLESHRGQEIGKWLMRCVMEHPSLQNLRRWSLMTQDAHGLYAQFGFTPLQWHERHMELVDTDVYKRGLPENE